MAAAAPVAPALASSYLIPSNGESLSGAGSFATPNAGGPAGGGSYAWAPPPPAAPGGTYMGGTAEQWNNLSKVNPYQGYIDAFNASQTKARAGIDQALHQSMGELGGRRDAAALVAAQLPGQVASAYNTAAGGLQSNRDAATGALSPDVKGSANALYGPLNSALLQDKAGAEATGPFIALAQRANYDSGAAALRNSAFQANAGLDAQNADFQQQLALHQADRSQQNADRTAQWAHDKEMLGIEHGYKTADAAAANKTALDSQPAPGPAGAAGVTSGERTAILASPAYQRWASKIISGAGSYGPGGSTVKLDPRQIVAALADNPKLLAVLQAEHPAFFFAADGKGGYVSSQLNSNLLKPGAASPMDYAVGLSDPFQGPGRFTR